MATDELDMKRFYSCDNCMLHKNGTCFGARAICEDFKGMPYISQEERDNWPEYGDALAFRFGPYNR